VVHATIASKLHIILFDLVYEFEVFLAFKLQNLVPTLSLGLVFGFIYTALKLGCVNNALIMCSENEVMCEWIVNCCSYVLLVVKESQRLRRVMRKVEWKTEGS